MRSIIDPNPYKNLFYAWFNIPDSNPVYSSDLYLAGLPQQQKFQKFPLKLSRLRIANSTACWPAILPANGSKRAQKFLPKQPPKSKKRPEIHFKLYSATLPINVMIR